MPSKPKLISRPKPKPVINLPGPRAHDSAIIAERSIADLMNGDIKWTELDGAIPIARAHQMYDAGLAEICTGRRDGYEQLFCIIRKQQAPERTWFGSRHA